MSKLKIVFASQARNIYKYENIKTKVHNRNTTIVLCKLQFLKKYRTRYYVGIKIPNTSPAVRYTKQKDQIQRNCLSNKVSNIIRRLMDNVKLLLICVLLLSHSFIFFSFCFLPMYLWYYSCLIIRIFTVMTMYSYCMFTYGYPDWGFSVFFSSVVRQMPG